MWWTLLWICIFLIIGIITVCVFCSWIKEDIETENDETRKYECRPDDSIQS